MRLPEFFIKLSPIRETLAATEAGEALLAEETAKRNAQLTVSTAEEGLSLWEADYALSSGGDMAARRARVRAALAGGQTLTVERLEQLAVTVGGADRGKVEEDFPNGHVTLYALYDGRPPEDVAALKEAVERLKPAHLTVEVAAFMALQGTLQQYHALMGKVHLMIVGRTDG